MRGNLEARIEKLEERHRPRARIMTKAERDAAYRERVEEYRRSPELIEKRRAELAAARDPRFIAAFEALVVVERLGR